MGVSITCFSNYTWTYTITGVKNTLHTHLQNSNHRSAFPPLRRLHPRHHPSLLSSPTDRDSSSANTCPRSYATTVCSNYYLPPPNTLNWPFSSTWLDSHRRCSLHAGTKAIKRNDHWPKHSSLTVNYQRVLLGHQILVASPSRVPCTAVPTGRVLGGVVGEAYRPVGEIHTRRLGSWRYGAVGRHPLSCLIDDHYPNEGGGHSATHNLELQLSTLVQVVRATITSAVRLLRNAQAQIFGGQ